MATITRVDVRSLITLAPSLPLFGIWVENANAKRLWCGTCAKHKHNTMKWCARQRANWVAVSMRVAGVSPAGESRRANDIQAEQPSCP